MAWIMRPVISPAMIVVPDPLNGSYTAWPALELFSMGRFMHSTGFCVLWPVSDFCGLSICQSVVCLRSPAQLAVPRAAYQQLSCCG